MSISNTVNTPVTGGTPGASTSSQTGTIVVMNTDNSSQAGVALGVPATWGVISRRGQGSVRERERHHRHSDCDIIRCDYESGNLAAYTLGTDTSYAVGKLITNVNSGSACSGVTNPTFAIANWSWRGDRHTFAA